MYPIRLVASGTAGRVDIFQYNRTLQLLGICFPVIARLPDMMKRYCFALDDEKECPIEGFWLKADDSHLHGVEFVLRGGGDFQVEQQPNAVHRLAQKQLQQYFSGNRKTFDLPISPAGTPFQMQVWQAMLDIPYGATTSYGRLASSLGGSGYSRAVGQAANKNPLPVIIPCHRVVGGTGTLTGFSPGIGSKKYLLELERGLLWRNYNG